MKIGFNSRSLGIYSLVAVGIYSVPLVFPQILKILYEKKNEKAPTELVTHVKKVAHLMGVIPKKSENLKVFITHGMSSITFGSPSLPFGAYIGLPRQFLWAGIEDAVKTEVVKSGTVVDWDSDFGQRLAKCLVPSGSQINFRIAHELAHIKSKHILYTGTVPPLFLFMLWVAFKFVTPFFCTKFDFNPTRTNLFIFVAWMLFFLFEMSKLRHHYEFEADRIAAGLGRGFAEGGIELFLRQRQIAALLGDDSDTSDPTHPAAIERQKKLQAIMIEKYQYHFD